ncbi:MAG: hypothetical protein JW820_12480 [Spirochaetales bacterium]|nr:hypothetical protein [Spirochaetales bacterium]
MRKLIQSRPWLGLCLAALLVLAGCPAVGPGGSDGEPSYTLSVEALNGSCAITAGGETLPQAASYEIAAGAAVSLQALDTTDGYGFSAWGGDEIHIAAGAYDVGGVAVNAGISLKGG